MSPARKSFESLVLALLLVVPVSTLFATDQTTTPQASRHHKARKKKQALVLPPLPAGPLRQVPMDQLPAAPPKVSYQSGLLSIAAQNATLGEILQQVSQLTGASIDLPPNGANERVVTQLGPGAPRDVLALLLAGTAFNYVLLGSPTDPATVATVLLTAKPSSGETQTVATALPPEPTPTAQPPVPFRPFTAPIMPRNQTEQPAAAAEDTSDDSESDDSKDDESDQNQQDQGAMGQPVAPVQQQPDQQQFGPNQPNAGPRTPEQMLQMMRPGQAMIPPPQQPPQE